MSTADKPPNLPRILCLHGGGTSALIFKIQTRRLQHALRPHFHFVFVDAPFDSGPGPGVLPVFADCGPYYSWMHYPNQLLGQQRSRQVIKEAIAKDGGEFVGVLGFSQGGRMTAGLLADLQGGEEGGLPRWRFGVCLCASYPPLSMEWARKEARGEVWKGKSDWHGEVREVGKEEIIHVRSVHVRGTLDKHCEKGRRLVKYFDKGMVADMEFVMGHHLPGAAGDTTSDKGDTDRIKDAILRFHRETRTTSNGDANGVTSLNGQ